MGDRGALLRRDPIPRSRLIPRCVLCLLSLLCFALLSNMVTSLILHERILTTHTKAKYAQRFAEKMVAYARRNTPNAKVKIGAFVKGEEATAKLFGVLAQRYASGTHAQRTAQQRASGKDEGGCSRAKPGQSSRIHAHHPRLRVSVC